MISEEAERSSLELWAGVECTVNRVGDQFFDQLELSGHSKRVDDLDLFAELGIKTMRYPVLWERTAPHDVENAEWAWADERLRRLHLLGIRPIVGLIHHGSGPRHTSLVDPRFAEDLARYARAVARRYPWVDAYTPVNEPLTTARFSGLYGFWYPHAGDELSFARAFLTQCRAVVLAMREIREVNPHAQLVQTDDLGKTFSTPGLAYQAEFENERRWLTFDLLCGRVDCDHLMWDYLRWAGITKAELEWFLDNPCPPDVIGINYYLTSERFLDERLDLYPPSTHGGNDHQAYADVEAVRVRAAGMAGPRELLVDAWERYHSAIAITEVHNGCTREEQLRWFMEVWNVAENLRREGVDIRAVTAWALLGSYDWNNLVTCSNGHYEPGVFDLRASRPRATVLAQALCELAAERKPDHPILAVPGWWNDPRRLLYGFAVTDSGSLVPAFAEEANMNNAPITAPRPILITGATGTLGKAFARLCEMRNLPFQLLTRQEMDIADQQSVVAALDRIEPWAIVNAAGYVRVDDAEHDFERCFRENVDGPTRLAIACASRGIQLLAFSSDLVFDGERNRPYVESDCPAPLSMYGRSKVTAEMRVLEILPSALMVRTSAFFGPWDEHNFMIRALRTLAAGQMFVAADDSTVSPTYVPDLVHACLDLLIDGERGVWHLTNAGATDWAQWARSAARLVGLDPANVEGCATAALGFAAPRPRYSVLGSERGTLLQSFDDALACFLRDCEISWMHHSPDEHAESTDALTVSANA